jgi:hypothetical protein
MDSILQLERGALLSKKRVEDGVGGVEKDMRCEEDTNVHCSHAVVHCRVQRTRGTRDNRREVVTRGPHRPTFNSHFRCLHWTKSSIQLCPSGICRRTNRVGNLLCQGDNGLLAALLERVMAKTSTSRCNVINITRGTIIHNTGAS